MAKVDITDDLLVVNVTGWDRVWALKSRLEIPLAHVAGARVTPGVRMSWKTLRLGGTMFPGVIAAGRFYELGCGLVFWDVRDPEQAITIKLRDERYQQLVIEVDDPPETVERIRQALPGAASTQKRSQPADGETRAGGQR